MPQSADIGQNPGGSISHFQICGQSLIKENCPNSRTSDGIDMKLGPVTKPDKRNKTALKNFYGDVKSVHYDVILILLIWGQFGAIRELESGRIVYKTYIAIKIYIHTPGL